MSIKYDPDNIFAKILRNEIPCTKIYEDNNVLCFEDISRAAPIHWLVITKRQYVNFTDFTSKASPEEVARFFGSINAIISQHNLNEKGFRMVTNNGTNGGQSVFHFHMHILSGTKMKELHEK